MPDDTRIARAAVQIWKRLHDPMYEPAEEIEVIRTMCAAEYGITICDDNGSFRLTPAELEQAIMLAQEAPHG